MVFPKTWLDRPPSLDPIAGETLEQWEARVSTYVAANPSLVTLINGAALTDLEQRAKDYIDAQIAPLMPAPDTITAVIDYWDAEDLGAGGSAVSSWTGRKGKALAQATSGSRPVVSAAALNGKKTVTFDGADDYLTYAPGSAFVTTANMECYVVLKRTGGSSNQIIVALDTGAGADYDTNGAAEVIGYNIPSETMLAYRFNVSAGLITWPAARTTYGLLHSYWAGTTHTIHEGATTSSITNGTWGSFNANRLTVGTTAGAGFAYYGGSIAALVLANGLTVGERTTITNYLLFRYGL